MPLLIEEKLAMQSYLALYIKAYAKPAESKIVNPNTKKHK